MKKKNIKKVSFFNWFITLLLSAIPGVNLLMFIFTVPFAKNPSKRTFAVAGLVLTLIVTIALCVLVFWFGDSVVDWAETLLKTAEETV